MKHPAKSGFTLIELLVALAILGVIVVMCGMIFEQSNLSWSTGSRKAEVNMVGRGVADFISQDIGRCIARTPADFNLSGDTLTFTIIDENAVSEGNPDSLIQTVEYNLNAWTRNGVELAPSEMIGGRIDVKLTPASGVPAYDVIVPVTDSDKTYIFNFKSRAWLVNRDRYSYDE